jgi:putative chitinase
MGMLITEQNLNDLQSGCEAAVLAPLLSAACAAHGVNTPMRIAAFVATCCVESAGLTRFIENLNYSEAGLKATFGARATSAALAACRRPGQAADQEKIANIVYGGEFGRTRLGNTQPGDGARYRGRGPGQVTGRDNYQALENVVKLGLMANPEQLADPAVGFETSALLWESKRMNAKADAGDPVAIRRAWNGGLIGLEEFKQWLGKTNRIWPTPAPSVAAAASVARPPPPPPNPRP